MDAHAALNAALNLTALVLLVAGRRAIARGDRTRHKTFMISAFGVSIVFLVSYVIRFAAAGEPTRFPEAGWIKSAYLLILLTHTVLAAIVPFLALRTLYLGLKSRFEQHKRIARWTYPIWVYVSATGVVIYVMLYHVAPHLG